MESAIEKALTNFKEPEPSMLETEVFSAMKKNQGVQHKIGCVANFFVFFRFKFFALLLLYLT